MTNADLQAFKNESREKENKILYDFGGEQIQIQENIFTFAIIAFWDDEKGITIELTWGETESTQL